MEVSGVMDSGVRRRCFEEGFVLFKIRACCFVVFLGREVWGVRWSMWELLLLRNPSDVFLTFFSDAGSAGHWMPEDEGLYRVKGLNIRILSSCLISQDLRCLPLALAGVAYMSIRKAGSGRHAREKQACHVIQMARGRHATP